MGYVLEVGPEFFLLLLVSDDILYNGFSAMRIDDVTSIEIPHRHSSFVEKALKLRGQKRPEAKSLRLSSLEELLRTASEGFSVLTIHPEKIEPDACYVGKVVDVRDSILRLREISPDAAWQQDSEEHNLRDITRVDFGGAHEEALMLVGGFRIITAWTCPRGGCALIYGPIGSLCGRSRGNVTRMGNDLYLA